MGPDRAVREPIWTSPRPSGTFASCRMAIGRRPSRHRLERNRELRISTETGWAELRWNCSGRATESGAPRFESCRLPLHDRGKIEYVAHGITATKDSE